MPAIVDIEPLASSKYMVATISGLGYPAATLYAYDPDSGKVFTQIDQFTSV